MKLSDAFNRAQEIVLCIARKWWRPIACWGVGLSIFNVAITILVGGVILPLKTGEPPDFSQLGALTGSLAALVASLTPFVAARSWDKAKGVSDD